MEGGHGAVRTKPFQIARESLHSSTNVVLVTTADRGGSLHGELSMTQDKLEHLEETLFLTELTGIKEDNAQLHDQPKSALLGMNMPWLR